MSNGVKELIRDNGRELMGAVDPIAGCPSPIATTGAASGGDGASSLMRAKILAAEAAMMAMPPAVPGKIGRIEIPTFHHFAPGVYMREIRIPKGAQVVGKIHKTTHLNILASGKLALAAANDGEPRIVTGPMVIVSEPGEKRLAEALEDSVWITVHPNPDDERDVLKLEERLVVETFAQFQTFVDKIMIEEKEGEQPCHSSP